jgi:riboflavin synthase
MFTGIITDVGVVRRVERRGDLRLVIATDYDTSGIDLGASIACSGACLTVVDKTPDSFAVDVSAESVSKTTIGGWDIGTRVNLERALALGTELGGHLVTGHVDGLATLEAIEPDGDSRRLTIRVPAPLARYVASKGSVALDGISLTVNEVSGDRFGVNIIPHTWENTTLADRRTGDALHMEVDLIARYVARLLEAGGDPAKQGS